MIGRTNLHDTQHAIQLLRRQIETFYRVNRFVVSIDDLDSLLGLIMQEATYAVEAEASCIALFDQADNCLHLNYSSGEKGTEVRGLTLPLGRGILGQVGATMQSRRVDDAQRDSSFDPAVDKQTGFTTKGIGH